ncbi:MAG: PDDEXK nuclease domain-containing protein [Paludibacteraceae bacterium]|nr:PDDEXK nuclease domain-containing protein [Paludibacteraceae bacterium]
MNSIKKEESVANQQNFQSLLNDASHIVEEARENAIRAVNVALTVRNWKLGERISRENLEGKERSEYGKKIMFKLSEELTKAYGKGFDRSSLYKYMKFYQLFPQIVDSTSPQSFLLPWSLYRELIHVEDKDAREWYAKEAFNETWSVKTLHRNIATQYYHRLLLSQNKQPVIDEMHNKTADFQLNKLEFIKNPIVAEFLGLSTDVNYTESKLESCIISHIQNFMLELGKGFAFVGRQQHVRTDMGDHYIDLVFYNYILKCFCLVDLKTEQISHQDVGQMDMYVRMYDTVKRTQGGNPTIGLLLCSQTSEDMARYSVLNGSHQIFQAQYIPYLPTKEELAREIELQTEIFRQQNEEDL